jgi:hypothetical protein
VTPELLQRAEGQIIQLRRRAEDLYSDEQWTDGDLLMIAAEVIEDLTLPSRLERTQDA